MCLTMLLIQFEQMEFNFRDPPEVCQLFKLSKDIIQNCLETLLVQCFYFHIK